MRDDVAALRRMIVLLTKERDRLHDELQAEREAKMIGEVVVMRAPRRPEHATNENELSLRVIVRRGEVSDDGISLLQMLGVLGNTVARHFGIDLRGKVLQL